MQCEKTEIYIYKNRGLYNLKFARWYEPFLLQFFIEVGSMTAEE